MKKKLFMGVTGIVLTMSFVASGCGYAKVNGRTISASDSAAPPDREAPMEIVIANNFNPADRDGNYVQQFLEKKFNVKIVNVPFDRSTWREKFGVMLASGKVPDIFPGDAAETDMVQWADQGMIASIRAEEIRRYMPKYTKDVEAVAANAWDPGSYKGKNWGVPKVWNDGSTGFLPAYNEAWLKAIGYGKPPKTLEELEDVLTKFTYNDPDGNGKQDTFGMTARGRDYPPQMFNSIFAAFGIAPYQFTKGPDGKLVYGGITERTRQALKLLHKWYEAGIIDPEFFTADNSRIREKFTGGRVGMFDTGMWHQLYKEGYFGKAANEQGVALTVGKPVEGPNGDAYAMSLGALQAPLMFGVQLEKDTKKRIKILQMLEYMATDDEGYLTSSYGEKGIHYDLDGDLAVPKPQYVDVGQRGAQTGAGGFYNPFIGKVNAMQKHDLSRERLQFKAGVTGGIPVLSDALGPAVLETRPKVETILQALQKEYFIKAITGEADTDRAFNQYVGEWLSSGGKELMEEANKVYAERNRK